MNLATDCTDYTDFFFTRTERAVSLRATFPVTKYHCLHHRNVISSIDAIKNILFGHKESVLSVALSKTETSVKSVSSVAKNLC
jgi:hypothetical protein